MTTEEEKYHLPLTPFEAGYLYTLVSADAERRTDKQAIKQLLTKLEKIQEIIYERNEHG